ncbi:hypothetical protein GLOTRDRAFT_132658 [Gloeophyllum trabeum ATCC 11539]|uniref:Uncharacterized protein n=1 Tax=Gloeophyllum trabeum (strain ATCC 11539 / FP-39264 / Madison 617) TaxID=670483 RepID=S7PWT3_GLOTA|nr:uncharacterized protein GLOTRDRAFT_132658 [Gloeophyllum trabeum ATCC 11539]EPQ51847.1 hypothetical protein GLOTRDRAFT_132658 [Gloeophyllum trabeum ATCC 11539]
MKSSRKPREEMNRQAPGRMHRSSNAIASKGCMALIFLAFCSALVQLFAGGTMPFATRLPQAKKRCIDEDQFTDFIWLVSLALQVTSVAGAVSCRVAFGIVPMVHAAITDGGHGSFTAWLLELFGRRSAAAVYIRYRQGFLVFAADLLCGFGILCLGFSFLTMTAGYGISLITLQVYAWVNLPVIYALNQAVVLLIPVGGLGYAMRWIVRLVYDQLSDPRR